MSESLFNKIEKNYKDKKNIKQAIFSLSEEEKSSLINLIKNSSTDMEELVVYTDGASRGNPGDSGYGYLIYNNNRIIEKKYGYIGQKTNNQAEYFALLEASKSIKNYSCSKVKFFLDSQLVVRQLKGIYRVKNRGLKDYYNEINQLLKDVNNVQFVHIPREENTEADKLANQAIDEHNA